MSDGEVQLCNVASTGCAAIVPWIPPWHVTIFSDKTQSSLPICMEVVACEPDTVARIGKSTTIFCELLGYFYVFYDLKIFNCKTGRQKSYEDIDPVVKCFEICIGSMHWIEGSIAAIPPEFAAAKFDESGTDNHHVFEGLTPLQILNFVCISASRPLVSDCVEER